MKLNPRPATDADIADYVTLVESAYRGDASRAGWTTEADLLGGQRLDSGLAADAIHDPNGVVLLCRDEAGCALASVQLRRLSATAAYLGTLAVSPDAQAGGIGKELIRVAEDYVVGQWGVSTMEMTVISKRSELIAYYERRGYQRTGETEPFPYGNERFGSPKVDDLEFAVLRKQLAEAESHG